MNVFDINESVEITEIYIDVLLPIRMGGKRNNGAVTAHFRAQIIQAYTPILCSIFKNRSNYLFLFYENTETEKARA